MNNEYEHDNIDNVLSKMSPSALEEILDSISGTAPEARKERNRINAEIEKFLHLPVAEWPEFEIKWDLSPGNFHFVFDGMKKEEFEGYYPEGFSLGWVSFPELDSKLTHFSQRSVDETWCVGFTDKVARAMLHWIEGNDMTPPLISPNENQINIKAGHHRVAVCRGKKIQTIPVLAESSDIELLEKTLLSLKWSKVAYLFNQADRK